MEQLIVDIITKVRRMYKYDSNIKDIVAQTAKATLVERNGKLVLAHIDFNYYDKVCVSSNSITYHPEHGYPQKLITYRDFYHLLEL